MKPPPEPTPWDELVRRARADQPPALDLPGLLRTVRQAPPPSPAAPPDWLAELAGVFGTRRAFSLSLSAALAFALVAGWQAVEIWRALPWAEWLTLELGGGL